MCFVIPEAKERFGEIKYLIFAVLRPWDNMRAIRRSHCPASTGL